MTLRIEVQFSDMRLEAIQNDGDTRATMMCDIFLRTSGVETD